MPVKPFRLSRTIYRARRNESRRNAQLVKCSRGATSYNIYRGSSPGTEYLVTSVPGLGYTDTGALSTSTLNPGYTSYGIYMSSGGTATNNVVYNNYTGIYSNSGAVNNNRVYDIAGSGIYAASSANASGNVVYSSMVGIEGDTSPTWQNNLLYANAVTGIWLHGGVAEHPEQHYLQPRRRRGASRAAAGTSASSTSTSATTSSGRRTATI